MALIRELDLVLPEEYEAHKKACALLLFELRRDVANEFTRKFNSSSFRQECASLARSLVLNKYVPPKVDYYIEDTLF